MTTVVATVPRLFVAWQDPDTRRFHPVAVLDRHGGDYRFRYLKAAEGLEGFEPFISFPELHRSYRSEQLFPIFANRLMSSRRPDYLRFLEDLGLDEGADDLSMLSRAGGRATDSVEIFAEPRVDEQTGALTAWFFVRGIRHQPGAEEAVGSLLDGEPLRLIPERNNPVTDQAILVTDTLDRRLGWMPDYLAPTVHRLWDETGQEAVRAVVERANPASTPLRNRILCRLNAVAPHGFQPFDSPQFLPLDSGDVS